MHSTLPVQQEHPGRPVLPPCRAGGERARHRLGALDGLRLGAALMVVAYHYLAFGSGAWPRSPHTLFPRGHLPASYGWLGVQLFFLISGFVICLSGWRRGLAEFAVSRITRLYPAYWFAVLAVTVVLWRWPQVNPRPGLRDAAVNLTMLQEPLGVEPVDGVYWTLWVEMRFYLLFALVVWRGLSYRRAVGFCLVWAFAALVARATGAEPLSTVLMPGDCWYFIAGISFCLMYRFGPNQALWLIIGGCFLITQHDLLAAQGRAEGYMGHKVPHWPAALLLTLFFLALAAVALGWTQRLEWRWLSTAGALTYPLYLLHERIGWVIIKHGDGRLPRYVLLPALVAGMLMAAWLVHRWVERPLARRVGDSMRKAVTAIRSG
ncbi:acyltransferase family protein [Streptomyces orinoci]|uniref:Acyltransferase n=1 Tax=Streptomyces orinoci TaxID=67339 RepID=A0ABV3JTQ2_STRON|nr:acyltransferase [Streptomyces orinoci]